MQKNLRFYLMVFGAVLLVCGVIAGMLAWSIGFGHGLGCQLSSESWAHSCNGGELGLDEFLTFLCPLLLFSSLLCFLSGWILPTLFNKLSNSSQDVVAAIKRDDLRAFSLVAKNNLLNEEQWAVQAVEQNALRILEWLIKQTEDKPSSWVNVGKDARFDVTGKLDYRPYVYEKAVQLGNIEALSRMLSYAGPCERDATLWLATQANRVDMMQLAADAGANPCGGTLQGAFLDAAIQGHAPEALDWLLAQKNFAEDELSALPLLTLAGQPCSELIKRMAHSLILAGAAIDVKDSGGATPLLKAIQKGNVEFADFLVDQHAQVNVTDHHGNTPLLLAVGMKSPENFPDEVSELESKPQVSLVGFVKKLFGDGAQANACNKDGTSPLHMAAGVGNADLVDLLMTHGAKIESQDRIGTPLFYACYEKHLEVVWLLISHGAGVETKNADGITPLRFISVDDEHIEMADLLLGLGADVNTGHEGLNTTPLSEAIEGRHIKMVHLLLERGADKSLLTSTQQALLEDLLKVQAEELKVEPAFIAPIAEVLDSPKSSRIAEQIVAEMSRAAEIDLLSSSLVRKEPH